MADSRLIEVRAGGEKEEPAGVQPVFFYDLADPECYLVAERIMGDLPVVPEWEPVHAVSAGLAPVPDVFDWISFGDRVDAAGLQPLRVPSAWPVDSRVSMLTATYAKNVGRAVAFSLAAFRQVFAGGRDPGAEDTALLAAAACEMHPAAVLKALGMRSVVGGLAAAGERCRTLGVPALPAITIGEVVFSGPSALDDACAALQGVV